MVNPPDDKDAQKTSISRWSRLKKERQAAANESESPPELTESEGDGLDAEAYCAQLPSIEELNEKSDFSVFMDERVRPNLRRQALRVLFKRPEFNLVDGLNDYDENYRVFEPLGDIVTADMKWMEKRKKQLEEELRQRLEAEEHIAEEDEALNDDKDSEMPKTQTLADFSEEAVPQSLDSVDSVDSEDSIGEADG